MDNAGTMPSKALKAPPRHTPVCKPPIYLPNLAALYGDYTSLIADLGLLPTLFSLEPSLNVSLGKSGAIRFSMLVKSCYK